MKISAKRMALLEEMRLLAEAMYGPPARIILGVGATPRIDAPGSILPAVSWASLDRDLEYLRSSVESAAANTEAQVEVERERLEAEVSRLQRKSAELVETLRVRGDRCRTLLEHLAATGENDAKTEER